MIYYIASNITLNNNTANAIIILRIVFPFFCDRNYLKASYSCKRSVKL